MVYVDAMIEDTDPGYQFYGIRTEHMETNLKQNDKIDEPRGKISMLNQSAGVQGIHMECTLPYEGKKLTIDSRIDVKFLYT